jgi:hypothetical protein
MCFSAEVSFGASAVITAIGVVSYKKANKTPLRYIAMIPILFGIHQFTEGIVWLSKLHEAFAFLDKASGYAFIFFAWVIWPFYIPLAMWKNEKHSWRRKMLGSFTLIGLLVSIALFYSMVSFGVESEIRGNSIYYDFDRNHPLKWLLVVLYFTTVVLSTVISNLSKMYLLGVSNTFLFALTKIYVADRVISVWCFMAALTSILILYIIHLETKARKNDT